MSDTLYRALSIEELIGAAIIFVFEIITIIMAAAGRASVHDNCGNS
jgi:hypothetical protein